LITNPLEANGLSGLQSNEPSAAGPQMLPECM
jgi:hypothetical protein